VKLDLVQHAGGKERNSTPGGHGGPPLQYVPNDFMKLILLVLCVAVCVNAQTLSSPAAFVVPEEKSKPITIPKFDKPPTIDGKLDEEVWQKAAVLKDFYQIQPGDNTPPSKPTEVLIGFDPKFLYIAFKATDEPDKVRATVAFASFADLRALA
jgi:hypothetical protein